MCASSIFTVIVAFTLEKRSRTLRSIEHSSSVLPIYMYVIIQLLGLCNVLFVFIAVNLLTNVEITVDNTTSVQSQSVCATYLGSPVPAFGTYIVINWTQPIVGRYVTVRQLGGPYYYEVQLSDVKIFGNSAPGESFFQWRIQL